MGITLLCSNACDYRKEAPPEEETSCSRTLSKSRSSLSSQPSLRSLPSLRFNSFGEPGPTPPYLLATLKGHSCYVSALSIHNNSLYSASPDQEIRLWTSLLLLSADSQPSASVVVAVAKSPIKSLLLSAGSHGRDDDDHKNLLISAHHDHKIRVWRQTSTTTSNKQCHYKLKAVLPTPKDRLLSLFSPSKYVQVRRRRKKRTWVHHLDAVSALAASPDGSLLYSVSWDRTLKVWRAADFACVESVSAAHHDAINAVAVSRDGRVYTGSADATIRVWKRLDCSGGGGRGSRKPKHSLVGQLNRHKSAVNALALSADGSVLYSGACDRSVVVWENMSAVGALRGHKKAILSLAVAGDVVCSGSADWTVRVWRRGEDKGYTCLAVLEGHRGAIKSLAIGGVERCSGSLSCLGSYSSSYLVCSGGMDCDIKVWKVLVPP